MFVDLPIVIGTVPLRSRPPHYRALGLPSQPQIHFYPAAPPYSEADTDDALPVEREKYVLPPESAMNMAILLQRVLTFLLLQLNVTTMCYGTQLRTETAKHLLISGHVGGALLPFSNSMIRSHLATSTSIMLNEIYPSQLKHFSN